MSSYSSNKIVIRVDIILHMRDCFVRASMKWWARWGKDKITNHGVEYMIIRVTKRDLIKKIVTKKLIFEYLLNFTWFLTSQDQSVFIKVSFFWCHTIEASISNTRALKSPVKVIKILNFLKKLVIATANHPTRTLQTWKKLHDWSSGIADWLK